MIRVLIVEDEPLIAEAHSAYPGRYERLCWISACPI
jgi:response regulator of citrate/malate metabolism